MALSPAGLERWTTQQGPSALSGATMQIDGTCHCGAASFTAEIDPSRVMLCHCTDCQVMTGSAFRAIVLAPIETFVVRGQTKSTWPVRRSGLLSALRAECHAGTLGSPQASVRTSVEKSGAPCAPTMIIAE